VWRDQLEKRHTRPGRGCLLCLKAALKVARVAALSGAGTYRINRASAVFDTGIWNEDV
jgi:hypothetical protein